MSVTSVSINILPYTVAQPASLSTALGSCSASAALEQTASTSSGDTVSAVVVVYAMNSVALRPVECCGRPYNKCRRCSSDSCEAGDTK